ncbi:GNAT family N-acetyltransferase [Streptomyces lydicus]
MPLSSAPGVRTDRLALRRFTPDDAELLVALHGDPEVMHFIDTGRPVPRQEVLERTLPDFLQEPGHAPGAPFAGPFAGLGVWAAEVSATGEFIGWFALRPTASGPADEAELGYRLCRAAWGAGYATEGARALIGLAFAGPGGPDAAGVSDAPGGPGGPSASAPGVRRIMATTMTVNHGSRRVMEKSGLRYVRTFFEEWPDYIEGAEHGDVEYAVTREEWVTRGEGTAAR